MVKEILKKSYQFLTEDDMKFLYIIYVVIFSIIAIIISLVLDDITLAIITGFLLGYWNKDSCNAPDCYCKLHDGLLSAGWAINTYMVIFILTFMSPSIPLQLLSGLLGFFVMTYIYNEKIKWKNITLSFREFYMSITSD